MSPPFTVTKAEEEERGGGYNQVSGIEEALNRAKVNAMEERKHLPSRRAATHSGFMCCAGLSIYLPVDLPTI